MCTVYCVPWLLAARGGEGNYNEELCGQETACWRLKVSTKLLDIIVCEADLYILMLYVSQLVSQFQSAKMK